MRQHHKSQFSLLKDLGEHALELLLIRMKMARVDLLAAKDAVIQTLIAAIAIVVVFFLGFICLLFGLNAVLETTAKIWVFFGLAVLALVVIASLVVMIMGVMQGQQDSFKSTLDGLQDDIAYLRGQKRYADIEIEE